MRAIILCAGQGVRFRPLSFARPKPLTVVHGLALVEHSLRCLRKNGISDISLVTGYMHECFLPLKDAYDVNIVYNPNFETGNVSSLAMERDRLDDALVIDGDLFFIRNFFPEFFARLAAPSAGISLFVSQETRKGLEWEMLCDKTDRILQVKKWSPTGYAMSGVSYWHGQGAKALAESLTKAAPDEYWEDSALRILADVPVYSLKLEPFVQEIDTVMEAREAGLLSHEQIAGQADKFGRPSLLKGLTNHTWRITNHNGVQTVLRIPGTGTERYINRKTEPLIISLIKHLDLTPQTEFYPEGIKTTRFLAGHRVAAPGDLGRQFFARLAAAIDKLHGIVYNPSLESKPILIAEEIDKYEQVCEAAGTTQRTTPRQRDWMLERALAFDSCPQVLSHRDLLLENIMVSGSDGAGLQLIDFEYAGFTHALWDAAGFILESGITDRLREDFAAACGIPPPIRQNELAHMEILVDYIWGLWGLANNYTEYGLERLNRSAARFTIYADAP